jgi:hypothetical protein
MKRNTHWVFENDYGKWSLVNDKMERALNSPDRKCIVGPGINSAELYYHDSGSEKPTHGIVSHLSDGMSGDRIWIQYNLKTGRARLLSRMGYNK